MPSTQSLPELQQRISHLKAENEGLLVKLREAESERDAIRVHLTFAIAQFGNIARNVAEFAKGQIDTLRQELEKVRGGW